MKRFSNFGLFVAISICMAMLLSAVSMAADLKDIKGHWAEEYIKYGVEAGYISGYDDGTFLPDKTVTRAEFSKMINSAVKITSTGSAKAEFTDVEAKDWFFNEVKKAENAGYITGYEDGSFRPNNSVTRQEAAVILSRIVLPVAERKDVSSFVDGKTIDSWATDAVSMIAAKGYIKGDESGKFLPKNSLTRSQAAKLICEFVKNENIVNDDKNVEASSNEIVFSETLFTDNVIFDFEDDAEIDVTFKNCKILGNIIIKNGNVSVDLENSYAKIVNINADDTYISLDKLSTVKNVYVDEPVTLVGDGFENVYLSGDDLSDGIVKLSGNCAKLEVENDAIISTEVVDKLVVAAKTNLVIQSGTVKNLEVKAEAKGSTINLAKKAVVETANNKAAVTYVGSGTIEIANNEVTGVVYDGVTVDTTTGKKAEGDGTPATSDDFFKDVTVTPSKGKTNVSIASNITISFDNKIYDDNGKSIDEEYLEEVIELRRSSASGTKTSFTASITSSKNILMNPSSDLKSGTKYYVVIPEGAFTNEDGHENEEYVTYFTTKAADDDDDSSSSTSSDDDEVEITFEPESGKKLAVDGEIVVTFSEKVYKSSSKGTLTSAYCEDSVFEIREGSSSGDEIGFTAIVASTYKKVTLIPDEMLEPDKKYYIIVNKKLYDYNGDLVAKDTSYFYTEGGLALTLTPENTATNVSSTPEIVLEFSETVLNYNEKELKASDVEEAVEIRKSSKTGANIFFDAEVLTGGKKVVITPEELEAGVKYYVLIAKESFMGETSEEWNEEIISYFTVASATAPMVTPADNKKNVSIDTQIEVKFSDKLYAYSKTSTVAAKEELTNENIASYVEDKDVVILRRDYSSTSGREIKCDVELSSDGTAIILTPADELAVNREYFVVVKSSTLYVGSGTKKNSGTTTSFSTNELLMPEFYPEDGDKDVEVDEALKITFDENIYNSEGDAITARELKNIVSLYNRDTEEPVDFTAKLSGRVITVTPDEDLEGGTYYVLKVNAGTITNNSGEINQASSAVFRTEAKIVTTITFNPKSSATNVSVYVNPTITFASPIYKKNLDDLTETYVNDYIGLYTSSTIKEENRVAAIVEFSDDFKTFTIIPDEPLKKKTKYYVYVAGSAFAYETGTTISKQSKYFTTTNADEEEPLECPVCGGDHNEADCPENEPDVPVVECPFCFEAHDEADHVCSTCGEKGHESSKWCESCESHSHKTDDEHCEECGLWIEECEGHETEGGENGPVPGENETPIA